MGGIRDIWTVGASGGEATRVTDDPYLDWSPVWAPDGRHLYFSSDRGGSMNLWRVAIDEQSGKLLGAPEPKTTPSPDGKWLTFFTIAPSQEDIFIVAPDGSGLRQLTDDPHRDRIPRWSPDGSRIAFYSDRSGKYEVWTINRDGSGLRQVTITSGRPALYPVWSPDGRHVAYLVQGDTVHVGDLRKPVSEPPVRMLPRWSAAGKEFVPWTWSDDGRMLIGHVMHRSGISSGLAVYSFETNTYEKLTDFGLYPTWLNDGRRVLFCFKEKLYLTDTVTKKVREIMYAALSARTGEMLGAASLSPDQRTLYFSQGTIEADVWILSDRDGPAAER